VVLCSAKDAYPTKDLISPVKKYAASVLKFISLLTGWYPNYANKHTSQDSQNNFGSCKTGQSSLVSTTGECYAHCKPGLGLTEQVTNDK